MTKGNSMLKMKGRGKISRRKHKVEDKAIDDDDDDGKIALLLSKQASRHSTQANRLINVARRLKAVNRISEGDSSNIADNISNNYQTLGAYKDDAEKMLRQQKLIDAAKLELQESHSGI